MKNKKTAKPAEVTAQNLPKPFFAALPFAFLTWAVFAAYSYLKTSPVNLSVINSAFFSDPEAGFGKLFYLVNYLPSIIGVILLGISAYGIGCIVSRYSRITFEPDQESVFATAVGFTAVIYLLLIIGMPGLLYKLPVLALLAAGLAFGILRIIKKKPQLSFGSLKKLPFISKLIFIVSLVILAIIFIGSLTPETFYDTLNYHLGVPQQWISNHRIFPIENFIYSYFSSNMHILYVPGLLFGNDTTAKLTHFMFGLLTMYALYNWSKKHISSEAGILASFIVLSVPFVAVVMWKSAIEMSLAYFETLAVLSFLNFVNAPETDGKKMNWLALSAVFSGTAVGGKYLSVFNTAALAAALLAYLLINRKTSVKPAAKILVFGLVAAAMVSPYLVRNLYLKGNPTYPFGFSIMTDVKADVRGELKEVGDPPVPDRTIRNFLTLPWYIAMGQKTQEPFSGAALLILAPLPFLFRKTDLRIKLLGIYCLTYYFCWFYLRTYFRYIIPLTPSLALLFAYYIHSTKINIFVKNTLLIVFIILGLSTVTFITVSQRSSMDPVRVVLGIESKKDYLSTQRPTYPSPYYEVIDWANKNIPRDSKVIFLGECRTFYAKTKTVTYSTSDFCPMILWIKGTKTGDDAAKALRQQGVTHIFLNVPEARRLASYDMIHFEPDELIIFSQFWNKYVKEIYSGIADISLPQQGIFSLKKQQPGWWQNYSADELNYAKLYEIMPDAEAAKPHKPPRNFFLEPQLYSQARWQKLAAAFNSPGK